jgi:hypothetical protein
MNEDGMLNQKHQSLPRLELSDIATTLDEGITGWLDRHALECGPPKPDATATGTLVLATRVVGEVSSVCESWHLSTRVIPHSQPGWSVMQVSGPLFPVLALGEVITALRAFLAH